MQKLLKCAVVSALVIMSTPCFADDAVLDANIASLRESWGHIKYEITDKDAQQAEIAKLEVNAEKTAAAFPDRAEPKIWEAIILATDAGITKSISGLPKVKKAKSLLEEALKEDETALHGSAYTTLGSLYYQVPGWPISFGDKDKASQNLKAALSINPDGRDPNYFYGDFLLKKGEYNQAVTVLQHALAAPPRVGYEKIDAGRKEEINQAIAEATKHLGTQAANRFN